MYEDGWVSGESSLVLTQPSGANTIDVEGVVPFVDESTYTTDVQLLVDGREVSRATLGLGDFHLRGRIESGPARRRVELHFSSEQNLPGDDGRPVGSHLSFLGFNRAGE